MSSRSTLLTAKRGILSGGVFARFQLVFSNSDPDKYALANSNQYYFLISTNVWECRHEMKVVCSYGRKVCQTLEMWANAQRDGRPVEYRWRPLFNAAKFGWRPILDCRAVTLPRRETRWNLLGCLKLPDRSQPLVGRNIYGLPYYIRRS